MLFLRSMLKFAYYPIIVTAFLLVATRIWEPLHLLVPPVMMGFADYIECFVPLIVVIPISFLLNDDYEIELGLVCGVKTSRLMFSKFLPVLIYTLIPTYLMILLYQYTPFTDFTRYKTPIPIFVPDNFKPYLYLSVTVTILFFTSLFLFIRTVFRNCYVPVAAGICCYMIFSSLNTGLKEGTEDIRMSFFNPFISSSIVGNTVPNAYAANGIEHIADMWTYNRLFFFALAMILFILTYVLLQREKLHENFGE